MIRNLAIWLLCIVSTVAFATVRINIEEYASRKCSLANGTYEIYGSVTNASESSVVEIAGSNCEIILNNVFIDARIGTPINIKDGASVKIVVQGECELRAGESHAGIAVRGAYESSNITYERSSLILDGDSSSVLKVYGGMNASGIGDEPIDVSMYPSAHCGDITIDGGNVHAYGGSASSSTYGGGAGIGGAYVGDKTTLFEATLHGRIEINNGFVYAKGEGFAAGIGSAGNRTMICNKPVNSEIVINGGTIQVESGNLASGIGAGFNNGMGDVLIDGGTVIADVNGVYGIGCSPAVSGGNIIIDGANVVSKGLLGNIGGGTTSSQPCYPKNSSSNQVYEVSFDKVASVDCYKISESGEFDNIKFFEWNNAQTRLPNISTMSFYLPTGKYLFALGGESLPYTADVIDDVTIATTSSTGLFINGKDASWLTDNASWKKQDDTVILFSDATYEITGTSENLSVVVATNVNASIYLNNVTLGSQNMMSEYSYNPISISQHSIANIYLKGSSTLFSGLDGACIRVAESARCHLYSVDNGKATLYPYGGAAIGGSFYDERTGKIFIEDAELIIHFGDYSMGRSAPYSAGIGSGANGSCEGVTINGGSLQMHNYATGISIGAGEKGSCDFVKINGGYIIFFLDEDSLQNVQVGTLETSMQSCNNVVTGGSIYMHKLLHQDTVFYPQPKNEYGDLLHPVLLSENAVEDNITFCQDYNFSGTTYTNGVFKYPFCFYLKKGMKYFVIIDGEMCSIGGSSFVDKEEFKITSLSLDSSDELLINYVPIGLTNVVVEVKDDKDISIDLNCLMKHENQIHLHTPTNNNCFIRLKTKR